MDILQRAITRGDLAAVSVWLESGGDVNACDMAFHSPLSMAAGEGNSAIIEVLLSAGADPNERWPDWTSPIKPLQPTTLGDG